VPTVNQEAFDRGVRHAIHLQRLRTHEVNQIIGFLNEDVFPDAASKLLTRLERFKIRGFDAGPKTTKRIKDALDATQAVISGGLKEAGALLRDDLKALALTEAEWQQAALRASLPNDLVELGVDFELPTVGQLNKILTSRPFEGDILSGWWRKLGNAAKSSISQQIQIGITEGETNQQIVRRLTGTRSGQVMNGEHAGARDDVRGEQGHREGRADSRDARQPHHGNLHVRGRQGVRRR
jgi:hypothetical protein